MFLSHVSRLAFEHQRLDREALDGRSVERVANSLSAGSIAPSSNGSGGQQPLLGLEKPLNSPALLMVGARRARFQPAMDLAAEPVAQHRIHAVGS